MKTKEEILKGDLTAEEVQYEIYMDGFEGSQERSSPDYTEEERIGMIENYAKNYAASKINKILETIESLIVPGITNEAGVMYRRTLKVAIEIIEKELTKT